MVSVTLPPMILRRNEKGHRYIVPTSGPARPNEKHASDAPKPAGKGAPTFMRFLVYETCRFEVKRQKSSPLKTIHLSASIVDLVVLPSKVNPVRLEC